MNRTHRIVSVFIVLLAVQIIVSAQTFSRTDYPLLGNNHIVADLNGDGIPRPGRRWTELSLRHVRQCRRRFPREG